MARDQPDALVLTAGWSHRCCVNNINQKVGPEVCLRNTTIPIINDRWCTRHNCGASLRHCPECL